MSGGDVLRTRAAGATHPSLQAVSATGSIPIAGFVPTNGRKPRTSEKLRVQFRCGYVDWTHEYTADQLRWNDTGNGWDVVAVAKVGAVAKQDGRQANGAFA